MAPKLQALRLAILTDQGMRRTMNEDRVSEITLGESPVWGRGVLVADGMGGTAGGERASRIVAEDFAKRLKDWQVQPERLGDRLEGALTRHLMELTDGVHRRIRAEAATDPGLEGMGSTLTMLVIIGVQWCCVHVGDSCAYVLRGKRLSRMTTDHAAAGSGALLQHMGGEREVDPQVMVGHVAPGDVFLVCTDGLTKHLEDGDIAHILGTARDPAEAAQRLVAEANRRGGKDNVSVGVIMPPASRPAATSQRVAGDDRRRRVLIPMLLIAVLVLVGAAAASWRAMNEQLSGGGGGGGMGAAAPAVAPGLPRSDSGIRAIPSDEEVAKRGEGRRDERAKPAVKEEPALSKQRMAEAPPSAPAKAASPLSTAPVPAPGKTAAIEPSAQKESVMPNKPETPASPAKPIAQGTATLVDKLPEPIPAPSPVVPKVAAPPSRDVAPAPAPPPAVTSAVATKQAGLQPVPSCRSLRTQEETLGKTVRSLANKGKGKSPEAKAAKAAKDSVGALLQKMECG